MRIHTIFAGIALAAMITAAHAQAPGHAPPAAHGAMSRDAHGHMSRAAHRRSTATAFVVQFKVKPGEDGAFKAAFRTMEAKVRANELGNLSYDLYSNGRPHTYVIIERYKDQAAVAAHGRDAHNLMSDLRATLDGRPTAQRLTLVSSK
ncbi:MAG: putative quinol monooxygenase [Steroidobacteraceae bacterium]